ncbi:electron transfer flavoprotein subunit alpha [Shewanella sp. NFH-SH190041]|uniref:electron transfer flavoprotein subunit alpha/FixB family protein n=1 Tax=Shewanella sp. NFH-SH190041 TaxID=2950245 RepID=UPI0021C2AFCC|nr:FAD-binding protein [Shewanella sp. NFH-SH190041]BDM64226.1 electron transfer flavoprotein subunit alpha [Shewanella sp. NFH-SH190041]
MRILVIAEQENGQLVDATLSAVAAAQKLAEGQDGATIDLLAAGFNCSEFATQCTMVSQVAQVIHVDAPQFEANLAENMSALVVSLVQQQGYQAVICANTSFGKNVSPRVAALLDVAQVSDVIAINGVGSYVRPIYAGNVMLTCSSQEPIQVLTVRPTAFDKVALEGSAASIGGEAPADLALSRLVSREITESDRPVLNSAAIVVSGGRGMGSGENYHQLLEPLADKLGAALGASRAAVDAGYVPNDYQVGQTGKIVAPELYIAVGISGAIQHLAGMSDAKVIVAINKDPDAPIFQVADYGLEGDLNELVPELTGSLA